MNRLRRALVGALVVLLVALGSPASACSCARGDIRDQYNNADAAFIGTYVSRRDGEESWYDYLTFRVDESLKGELGETVEIRSNTGSGACGISPYPGPTGLLLYGSAEGGWSSYMCSQMSPDELREAASPLPEPDGEPPAKLLLGGSFGLARVSAHDRAGRTVRYGFGGDWTVSALSVCPRGRRSVEAFPKVGGRSHIAVRSLTTLEVISEIELPEGSFNTVVRCRNRSGSLIATAVRTQDRWRLLRIEGDSIREVYESESDNFALTRDHAFFTHSGRLIKVDLDTGAATDIGGAPSPRVTSIAASPDGTKVAIGMRADPDGAPEAKLFLIDLTTGGTYERSIDHPDFPMVAWWGNGKLLVYCWGGGSIFDDRLKRLGRLPVNDCPSDIAVSNRKLWWSDPYEAELHGLDLPRGEIQTTTLPSSVVNQIERIP